MLRAWLECHAYQKEAFNSFWDATLIIPSAGGRAMTTFNSFWDATTHIHLTRLIQCSTFNSFWDATRGAGTSAHPSTCLLSIPFGMLLFCQFLSLVHYLRTFNSFWDATSSHTALLSVGAVIFQFLLGCYKPRNHLLKVAHGILSIPFGMLR